MSINTENIDLNNSLIKYLDGQALESEKSFIEEWIAMSPENDLYFKKVKAIWNNNISEQDNKEFSSAKGWDNFNNKYNFSEKKNSNIARVKPLKTIVFNALKVAAVLVVGLFIWQSGLFNSETLIVNTVNEKEEVILPDSTSVFLNIHSKIAYKSNLERKSKREVNFSGEAFFDVAHNPDKPFIIYANNVKIEVKGTSFNLRAYPGQEVEVVVKTGIVEVTEMSNPEKEQPVQLLKGDKVQVDTLKNALAVKENDDNNYLAWKTESYKFDSVSIRQVMSTLEKGYDTTIIVKNSEFNDCMLVAKFDSLNLSEIFWILQRTYNISVLQSNDTVFVEGKGCN